MLPEPLRQGFDISNQTPPDSLQNPATRPHQKSVHFKRNIPLPVVPGQVLAHCISMDTSWYRSNVEKMCRGHPGHPTPQKMPLPRKLWWRRIWVHPEDFKMDGDGWNTNPSKCPFWDGLWHWVYHMILNITELGAANRPRNLVIQEMNKTEMNKEHGELGQSCSFNLTSFGVFAIDTPMVCWISMPRFQQSWSRKRWGAMAWADRMICSGAVPFDLLTSWSEGVPAA